MTVQLTPRAQAAVLTAFVDTLIPGDELFPPASATGAQGILADRIREQRSPEEFDSLFELLALHDVPFEQLSSEERSASVGRLEQIQPELFAFLLAATYLAYYAALPVIAAIRSLGIDYNDAPQPDGYELPRFTFTPGVDIPLNPTGSFKWTNQMERIDLSTLNELHLPLERG